MAGVRLHHPVLRGCLYRVAHPRKDFLVSLIDQDGKPVLDEHGEPKTERTSDYFLSIDEAGDVIVSPVVLERLREVGMAGFEISNEVSAPPVLTIGGATRALREVRFNPRTGQIRETGVIVR